MWQPLPVVKRSKNALTAGEEMKRSRRTAVIALLTVASTCAACHGERPEVTAQPADASVPGLLPGRNAPRSAPLADASPSSVDAAPSAAAAPSDSVDPAQPALAPRRAADSVPATALAAAVSANNAFAVALFAQVRPSSAKSNLLTSPISAELALTMAYAGATDQTRAEMATALSFGATPAASIFDGQNALSQALLKRGPAALALAAQSYRGNAGPPLATDYELQIVNSLWGERSIAWQTPFLRTLAANYGAPLHQRDFVHDSEAARQAINAWVSQQTRNKINDLLFPGAVSSETRLVLVNALHLKLPWQTPFQEAATAPAAFTRADKTQVNTPFMNSQQKLSYVDDGAAQVVSLPLAGKELSLIVALPHADTTLEVYERSLRAGSAALVAPKQTALVKLSLPRSTFTSPTFSLKEALQALGMKQAFDDQHAHFEGMCTQRPGDARLFVSDVLQKTMIDVQETGLEAAAATAVVMSTAMAVIKHGPDPVPIPMIVNRPYLIAVVDVPTGAILMLGHITDPSQAKD